MCRLLLHRAAAAAAGIISCHGITWTGSLCMQVTSMMQVLQTQTRQTDMSMLPVSLATDMVPHHGVDLLATPIPALSLVSALCGRAGCSVMCVSLLIVWYKSKDSKCAAAYVYGACASRTH